MPRGRAGLSMIAPEEVARVVHCPLGFRPGRSTRAENVKLTARHFHVAERTVRRWLERGLPLYYGENFINQDAWDAFVKQRGAKPVRTGSATDKYRSTPVRATSGGQVSARRRADRSRVRKRQRGRAPA